MASARDRAAQLIFDELNSGTISVETAFERLFRLYYPVVFYWFRMWCGSTEFAEDLTQETFFRVLPHLEGFRGDAPFTSYLKLTARRLLTTTTRNGNAQKRIPPEAEVSLSSAASAGGGELEVPVAPDQERRVHLREAFKALTAAVEELSPQQRKCVILRYYHDLMEHEVAAVLRISVGAVKGSLNQARRHLRQQLPSEFAVRWLPPTPGEAE